MKPKENTLKFMKFTGHWKYLWDLYLTSTQSTQSETSFVSTQFDEKVNDTTDFIDALSFIWRVTFKLPTLSRLTLPM